MIFATVGAQMPFDRLVETIDRWAGADSSRDVFAQIGRSDLRPSNIRWCSELEPDAFRKTVIEADLVVSHAGMGTILTALELGKPILVMPRLASHRETRNDHQVAGALAMQKKYGIAVARDESHLLDWLRAPADIPAPAGIAPHASFQLLGALREFINEPQSVPGDPSTSPVPVGRTSAFPQQTSHANQERKAA